MINKKNKNFETIFFKFFIIFLLILSLLFFLGSFYFNENFFLKYSVDKQLNKETIGKIAQIQRFFMLCSIFVLILFLLSLAFRTKLTRFIEKDKSLIQKILLLIASILLFLFIGEIIARIFLSGMTTNAGAGPAFIDFYKNYVHLNSDKLRDREYPIEKGNNTIRIAGLGDSAAYGFGVKDINNTVFKILESRLNKEKPANKTYELINFAKPGYDVEDELNVLKEKALKYSPDIIILAYNLNDLKIIDSETTKNLRPWLEVPYIGLILRNTFYLYYYLEIKINKIASNSGLVTTYEILILKSFNSSINREYNFKYFQELSNISRQENIPVIIIVIPVLYHLDNYPFYSANEYIENISRKYGFYYINPLEVYQKYGESQLMVTKYDAHPNELGHRLIADYVYESLVKSLSTNFSKNPVI